MIELKHAFKVDAINVQKIFVEDKEVPLGKKIDPISPLKNDADASAVGRKVNELIAALKIAGIMENKGKE